MRNGEYEAVPKAWAPLIETHGFCSFAHVERLKAQCQTVGGLSSWSFRPAVGQGEFLAWLLAKAGQSDIVGDLATDMVRDRLLPQTSDPRVLSDYLRTQTVANYAVQGALVSAWLAYHTGFKQFPIEVLNFLPLLKAYALLQGFFSSLDSDPESVERLYTDAHRRVLSLLSQKKQSKTRQGVRNLDHLPGKSSGKRLAEPPSTSQVCCHTMGDRRRLPSGDLFCSACGHIWDWLG